MPNVLSPRSFSDTASASAQHVGTRASARTGHSRRRPQALEGGRSVRGELSRICRKRAGFAISASRRTGLVVSVRDRRTGSLTHDPGARHLAKLVMGHLEESGGLSRRARGSYFGFFTATAAVQLTSRHFQTNGCARSHLLLHTHAILALANVATLSTVRDNRHLMPFGNG
jgi:hypothetical protein